MQLCFIITSENVKMYLYNRRNKSQNIGHNEVKVNNNIKVIDELNK